MKCSSILSILLIITRLMHITSGGHILALHFTTTGSYIRAMDGILNTLAPHHKITLYSLSHEDFPHPNVTVVSMKPPEQKNYFSEGLFEVLCEKGSYYVTMKTLMISSEEFIDSMYQKTEIQELLASRHEKKYDLLLTFTTFCEYAYQFAHVLNIPLVQIVTTIPLIHTNDGIGNSPFYSTAYQFYSTDRPNTIYKRLVSYSQAMLTHLSYNWYYMSSMNRATRKYLPDDTPPIEVIHRNTSLFLLNVNSAMGYVQPHMPHAIEIAGIHCKPAKPLSADLEEFITGSGEHGIIYFSLGTSIKSKFPEHMRLAILNVFRQLPQRILWKFNEEMTDIPSNVWISKWFPQQDVLGHNKTKLFITQAGIFSLLETVYHGVPILTLPIAFDQEVNSLIAEDLGYSEKIPFCKFTEEKFLQTINKMLSNSKYDETAKRISQLIRDQPQTSKEKIIWWIDYVIRHKGNPIVHQIPPRSSGLERLDIDLILYVFIIVILLLSMLSYSVFRLIKFLKSFKYYPNVKIKIT